MSDLSNNPLVNRRAAAALERMGVTVDITDGKNVTARLPERVEFAASSKIFLKLAQLGLNDYDTSTLKIDTCSGTVIVTFTLN
ncbi:MAG TPA: hypothetical protein VFS10_08830 [Pyrinomonadaceae bacterium]|nr:hypothetical protein [Pyrinomonadaceae bacterium]